jgi:hypothetical protein
LLILGRLLLAGLPPAGHGADNRANTGSLPGVSRNGADRRPTRRSTRGTAHALTAAYGWTGLLRRRSRTHGCRIDPGGLLCPSVTLCVIFFLLGRTLTFCGISDRLLRHCRGCD